MIGDIAWIFAKLKDVFFIIIIYNTTVHYSILKINENLTFMLMYESCSGSS